MDPMLESESHRALLAGLENFEACLSTPVVCGELGAWSQIAQAAWADLIPILQRRVAILHREEVKRIAQTDPDLLPQVVQLASEDQAILQEAAKIGRSLAEVAIEGASYTPKELKFKERVTTLVDHGMAFAQQVRLQGISLQTWLEQANKLNEG